MMIILPLMKTLLLAYLLLGVASQDSEHAGARGLQADVHNSGGDGLGEYLKSML